MNTREKLVPVMSAAPLAMSSTRAWSLMESATLLARAMYSTAAGASTTPTTPTDPQPAAVRGDVDADGKVSVSDVVMLQKYLFGAGSLKAPAQADLYEDGRVDVFDLAMLKRVLLGK